MRALNYVSVGMLLVASTAGAQTAADHIALGDKEYVAMKAPAALEHLRVDACETCHRYLKAVDLTKLGFAVPLVDEVAGASLDLWAREHGYEKIELNLIGL